MVSVAVPINYRTCNATAPNFMTFTHFLELVY